MKSTLEKRSQFDCGDTLSKAATSLLIMDHKLPAIESQEVSFSAEEEHSVGRLNDGSGGARG